MKNEYLDVAGDSKTPEPFDQISRPYPSNIACFSFVVFVCLLVFLFCFFYEVCFGKLWEPGPVRNFIFLANVTQFSGLQYNEGVITNT